MTTACKEWTGRKDQDGYGLRGYKGKDVRVHRIAWMEGRGPIPAGMCVLHKCDNRACHNVEHLFIGSQADNMRDMTAKGRRESRAPVGELNSKAKLTLAQVERIRADTRPNNVIAAEYGVSGTNIHGIKKGLIWKHGNGYVRNGRFVPA